MLINKLSFKKIIYNLRQMKRKIGFIFIMGGAYCINRYVKGFQNWT